MEVKKALELLNGYKNSLLDADDKSDIELDSGQELLLIDAFDVAEHRLVNYVMSPILSELHKRKLCLAIKHSGKCAENCNKCTMFVDRGTILDSLSIAAIKLKHKGDEDGLVKGHNEEDKTDVRQ